MYTIGELGKLYNLSRSTLLYYDSIGILKPSSRTDSNYRLYSEDNREKLEKICLYREIGLELKEIKRILTYTDKGSSILHNHLENLNQKINKIRSQQRIIVNMIKDQGILKEAVVMEKVSWQEILKKVGLKEKDTDKLHKEFEKLFPEKHQYFLEALGFSQEEIIQIRNYYNFSGD